MLHELRKKKDKPFLVVDGGALLFESDRLLPGKQEQAMIAAQGIAETYNKMEYAAVGVAPQDLAGGVAFLQSIANKSKFAWLSANLVRKSTGNSIFPASIVTTMGPMRVGIIGLTGTVPQYLLQQESDAAVIPWQEVLPDLAAELATSTDLIVLLSSLDADENQQISKTLTDINIIIQAVDHSSNRYPSEVNNTLNCQVLRQGKYFGMLEFSWGKQSVWGQKRFDDLFQKQQEFERYELELTRYRRYGKPEKVFKSEPIRLGAYQDLLRRHDRVAAEIERLEKDLEEEREEGIFLATYKNHFIALEKALPDDKIVLAIVEDVKKKVHELGRKKAQQVKQKRVVETLGEGIAYIGSKACSSCHESQTVAWKKTQHAKAFTTLLVRQQQYNMNCVPCHVTGVVNGNEPYAYSLPEPLYHVGCEVCHGSGIKHALDPKQFPLTKLPPPATCTRCHSPERDDSFSYQKEISLVSH